MDSFAYQCFFIESDYKQLKIDNVSTVDSFAISQNSNRRSGKAVNFPQADKEMTFHVHMFVEILCIVVQKYPLPLFLTLSLVLNVSIIFHQISYKIVLIKTDCTTCRSATDA